MKKTIFITALILFGIVAKQSSNAQIIFQKALGGAANDRGNGVSQTTDGGYIITGQTYSFGAGDRDVYLNKTDASGNLVWSKTYGGTESDVGMFVQQTTDGGYIIAGRTKSFGDYDGDVYLIKTDDLGNLSWSKTYGGTLGDIAYLVQQTTDGGYIIAARTESYGAGYIDVYLIKTDASGNLLWSKTYGGSDDELVWSVQQTTDGGYIIGGSTYSFAIEQNLFLIKTDASGNPIWAKTYGGDENDRGGAVQQTADGGYILAGWTYNFGAGVSDYYLIKTNFNGNLTWSKRYGGSNYDLCSSVHQTYNGGYIMAGSTISFGAGAWDFYAVRTDAGGTEQWSMTYGDGNADVYGYSVQQTTDLGFVMAGFTQSFGAGGPDVYLIKTDYLGISGCFENPVSTPGYYTPTNVSSFSPVISGGATVTDPGTVVANAATIVTDITVVATTWGSTICSEANNGIATVVPTGGTPPYTYLWSNGQTTASATGLTAGTYTVTVTDAIGCTTTAQATIDSYTPVIPVITGFNNVCSQAIYTVAVSGGTAPYTYNWNAIQLPPPLFGAIPPNQLNVGWDPLGSSGTVFVTVTDVNGCSGTASFQVFECCTQTTTGLGTVYNFNNTDATDVINNIYGSNIIDGNFGTPPDKFVINGDFTVDQDLTFTNMAQVYLGPDARVFVKPGITLTLEIRTMYQACANYVWDGIYIEDNTAGLIVDLSTIMEARNAVVSQDGGYYKISNASTMDVNYRHIVVEPYPTAHNGEIFQSQLICDGTMLPPFPPGTRTNTGIDIRRVDGIVIGDWSDPGFRNTFDNMDFGIRTIRSKTEIYNNKFQNLAFNAYPATKGTGVFAVGQSFDLGVIPELTVGGAGARRNFFSTCKTGVYASLGFADLVIANNQFDNIPYCGVRLQNVFGTPITIRKNEITNYGVGIFLQHFPFSPTVVFDNILDQGTPPSNVSIAPGNFGIYAGNIALPSFTNENVRIVQNTIINKPRAAISATYVPNLQINANVVDFDVTNAEVLGYPYFNYHYGIAIGRCPEARVFNNDITRPFAPDLDVSERLWGIAFGNNEQAKVIDNRITNMGSGIRAFESCPNSDIRCNRLTSNFYGIRLRGVLPSDDADIGDQGSNTAASDNIWISDVPSQFSERIYGKISPLNSIEWWRKTPPPPALAIFDPLSGVGSNSIGITYKLTYGNGCGLPNFQETPGQRRERLFGAIARDERQFNANAFDHKLANRQYAYRALLADSLLNLGLPDDSTFQNFADTTSIHNTGLFTEVQQLVDANDFAAAAALNASCTPNCLHEGNRKAVNGIFLQTWANHVYHFNPAQLAMLHNIACQDPLLGGDAVYSARVLLGLNWNCQNNNKTAGGSNENGVPKTEKEETITNETAFVSKIYPNPNNGKMQFDYHLDEGQRGSLMIYNITGKLLSNYKLEAEKNSLQINESTLSVGIYFYRIIINDEAVANEKLIIIR